MRVLCVARLSVDSPDEHLTVDLVHLRTNQFESHGCEGEGELHSLQWTNLCTHTHTHACTSTCLPAYPHTHTHTSEVLPELHLQCHTNHIIYVHRQQYKKTDAPSTTVCSTALLSICSSLSTWEKSTSEEEEARETRASSFIFCRQDEGSRPTNGVTGW